MKRIGRMSTLSRFSGAGGGQTTNCLRSSLAGAAISLEAIGHAHFSRHWSG